MWAGVALVDKKTVYITATVACSCDGAAVKYLNGLYVSLKTDQHKKKWAFLWIDAHQGNDRQINQA